MVLVEVVVVGSEALTMEEGVMVVVAVAVDMVVVVVDMVAGAAVDMVATLVGAVVEVFLIVPLKAKCICCAY